MNPSYGIVVWIVVGALAGWVASMIMGTNAKQGGFANVIVGIIGAILGGVLTRGFFGDNAGDNGLISSFLVALLGSCALIAIFRLFSKRERHS